MSSVHGPCRCTSSCHGLKKNNPGFRENTPCRGYLYVEYLDGSLDGKKKEKS